MQVWKLSDAKANLDRLIELCQSEPQIINIGEEVEAILISKKDYGLFCTDIKNAGKIDNNFFEALRPPSDARCELNIEKRTKSESARQSIDFNHPDFG